MYKTRGRVRYSECGPDNRLTPGALINYFQDCTTENSERLGVGRGFLKDNDRAWVIVSWQVEINRFPKCSEEIEVATWATGFKGVVFPRDFCMKTLDGEVLAKAHSLWVYMDTAAMKMIKIEDEHAALYEVGQPLEMEKVSRKIGLTEETLPVDTFTVRKYHIDTNNHTNNCHYIQMAREVLPADFKVKKMRVEYKISAVHGDKIVLTYGREENRIVVQLSNEAGGTYAIVEFIGEN